MTAEEFLVFVRKTAHRATEHDGRVGNLVCTRTAQTVSRAEPKLREPELRVAMQQEAETCGQFYGIEVPTRYTYRFTGIGEIGRRALTDFALLESSNPTAHRTVLVEFKAGQQRATDREGIDDYRKITKDLHKLLAEPAMYGCCMLHVCHAADDSTIEALKTTYTSAMKTARPLADATIQNNELVLRDHIVGGTPWFLLLVLVVHQRGKAHAGEGPCLRRGVCDEAGQCTFERDHQFS